MRDLLIYDFLSLSVIYSSSGAYLMSIK